MTYSTFSPSIEIGHESQIGTKFRVLTANFGDGYEQSSPDGLNNVYMEGSLVWSGITDDQADEIYAFMIARQGSDPFYYTLPWEDSPRKFKCDSIDRTATDYDSNKLVVKVKETFVLD